MGLSVLAFPHVQLTRLRDGDPSHTGRVEDVIGEVDELEENFG